MKLVLIVACLAGCGGSNPEVRGGGDGVEPDPDPPGVVSDTRTPIEKRRDAACEKVGAKLTECALADAKADLAAGKVSKKDFDLNTTPDILRKHTEEFVEKCEVPLSSRQVRVLEVCYREETECGPLTDCLTHLNDHVGK